MIMLKGDEPEEKTLKEMSKAIIRKEVERELINKKDKEEFNK